MREQVKTYLLQTGLFLATIVTTTLAGMYWMGIPEFTWHHFQKGFLFSLPFLGILTIHEFGHYITARLYKVSVTLPYYIPFYLPFIETIGTMGAFIRIKDPLKTKTEIFDIGVAGPLAGFIAALFVLYYGFTHLPPQEYVLNIHKEYKVYGLDYEKHVYNYAFSRQLDSSMTDDYNKHNPDSKITWKPQEEYMNIAIGKNLLFLFFEKYIANQPERIPNKYEMFHYPFLFAGYLALFFTALNLLPMGQLDGGHVIYGLFGEKKHKIISSSVFIIFVYLAGIGMFRDNLIGNVFGSADNMMMFAPLYLLFLYFIFGRVSEDWKNNLMIASGVFAAQYFTELLFPAFEGFNGWFLFAILIGRFLGIHHPPALYNEPLTLKRKIIGWISLFIFIICFTPNIFTIEIFRQ
ncbi:MAG: site-2 protease family protein [Cytophagaceae bacterium]|nr:site-2 protease family protein [Cytophagaceae bacterium]